MFNRIPRFCYTDEMYKHDTSRFGIGGILSLCTVCALLTTAAPGGHLDPSRIDESVTVPGPAPEITLAGTLLLPEGATPEFPVPGIVLVTGSGAQDRDETIFGKRPFRILAEGLVARGYAVLRYDDRGTKSLGIGESTGSFAGSTTRDFADDARAVAVFLAADPRIDADRIVICGHSTGGLVSAMLLGEGFPFAAAVLLASPSVRGAELLIHQSALIGAAANLAAGNPVSPDDFKKQTAAQSRLVLAAAGDDPGIARAAVVDAINESLRAAGMDPATFPESEKNSAIDRALTPLYETWMAAFLRYDPREDLTRSKVPVFALFGGLDLQVDPAQNAGPMTAALRDAGHPLSAVVTLPHANHLFQHAITGMITEYESLEGEMPPLLIDLISAWLDRTLATRTVD